MNNIVPSVYQIEQTHKHPEKEEGIIDESLTAFQLFV